MHLNMIELVLVTLIHTSIECVLGVKIFYRYLTTMGNRVDKFECVPPNTTLLTTSLSHSLQVRTYSTINTRCETYFWCGGNKKTRNACYMFRCNCLVVEWPIFSVLNNAIRIYGDEGCARCVFYSLHIQYMKWNWMFSGMTSNICHPGLFPFC